MRIRLFLPEYIERGKSFRNSMFVEKIFSFPPELFELFKKNFSL